MTRNKSIFTKNFCPYGPKFLAGFLEKSQKRDTSFCVSPSYIKNGLLLSQSVLVGDPFLCLFGAEIFPGFADLRVFIS